MQVSPGAKFRAALTDAHPLQIVGTINAYTAMMAEQIGHRAIYLSGGACANMSFGLPDLGMTGMTEVAEDARRITAAVDTPLLVDIDTGWGGAFNIARTIKEMTQAGVAAVHIEDQVAQDRIKAAVDARSDDNFFIIARTDAYACEGLDAALDRTEAYIEAGADGIFAEAMTSLRQYQIFKSRCDVPLLANMTEFGRSPIFSKGELASADVDMILYPFTAARAMNKAAENVYTTLLDKGDQRTLIDSMQTRDALYEYLNYNAYESKLDGLFTQAKNV